MIIEFNTGKTDIVLVKVPESAKKIEVIKIADYDPDDYLYLLVDGRFSKLPTGNWQIVGNPFELSEEQWMDLLPSQKGLTWHLYENYNGHDGLFITAKEAGISLLNHLKVYRVNPYKDGKPSLYNHDVWYSEQEWQQAEELTGNWILLKKQS